MLFRNSGKHSVRHGVADCRKCFYGRLFLSAFNNRAKAFAGAGLEAVENMSDIF